MGLFRNLNHEEEQEFRQWARDNFTTDTRICEVWHPVVLDEIDRILDERGLTYINAQCRTCKEYTHFCVGTDNYKSWHGGKNIQDALPELSAGHQELLMSATCPKCWNEIFSK